MNPEVLGKLGEGEWCVVESPRGVGKVLLSCRSDRKGC